MTSADNRELLLQLLGADDETTALKVLRNWKLLAKENEEKCWRFLGDHPNNQAVVLAQQSTPAAALVEKVTNSIDAILLRHVRRHHIDPRGPKAPKSMGLAVEMAVPSLSSMTSEEIRTVAEENLVLYATGDKTRPCLSLFDAGEGQFAEDFPTTFGSLIYGQDRQSYKGAIPFVQGRFNMGGTGVLSFCGAERHLQLIVSRVPVDLAGSDAHEWAFTIFCFFPSDRNPGWRYLVDENGKALRAGRGPLSLLPKAGGRSGEVLLPRERNVSSGTLIKMYDFKAPRHNVCGELYRKLEEYLIQPALPLRIIECRSDWKANVMGATLWDRPAAWAHKLEEGFENGASFSVTLSTGERIPGAIRIFRPTDKGKDDPHVPTGLRALINGQSHAKRDAHFFRTRAVDKEHIAGSMLVTLDCTSLSTSARNSLFMSNREAFRDDFLLQELLPKVQAELKSHDALNELNDRRYRQKIDNAITDEAGIDALEDLLSSDPALADLFGTVNAGRVAARIAAAGRDGKLPAKVGAKFQGVQFPTYFKRKDGSAIVEFELPRGHHARPWFMTDVRNDYFSRRRFPGRYRISGDAFVEGLSLWNGRLSITCWAEKSLDVGESLEAIVAITDGKGSGPFQLTLRAVVVEAPERADRERKSWPPQPKAEPVPSRPDVREAAKDPEDPPIAIDRNPSTKRLGLVLNTRSELLERARSLRPPSERSAVEFVFKYGLALVVMALIDQAKRTDEWKDNEVLCRQQIETSARGIAKVIVPLCLTLPGKLPLDRS